MALLLNKTFDDLNTKTDIYFDANNISKTPGSIAKLIMNLNNTNESDLYTCLTTNHLQAFLSTATGVGVDDAGLIVNCIRNVGELDDDYKFRISKQILNSATANETAVRFAALSVTDVQDIVMKKFSFGSGSFSIFVLTNLYVASDLVIANVTSAVDLVAGYGIKYNIVNPDIKQVTIKVKLLNKDNLANNSGQDINYGVMAALKLYFTSMPIGTSIDTDLITKVIMNVSVNIVSYVCEELRINGQLAMYINQSCKWNERFMLSSDPNAIIIE